MTVEIYDQTLNMARQLNLPEQVQLLEALSKIVRRQVDKPQTHTVMDLEGLGAEIWQNVDAQTYVNQERALWDS